jgi:hypothetical protein
MPTADELLPPLLLVLLPATDIVLTAGECMPSAAAGLLLALPPCFPPLLLVLLLLLLLAWGNNGMPLLADVLRPLRLLLVLQQALSATPAPAPAHGCCCGRPAAMLPFMCPAAAPAAKFPAAVEGRAGAMGMRLLLVLVLLVPPAQDALGVLLRRKACSCRLSASSRAISWWASASMSLQLLRSCWSCGSCTTQHKHNTSHFAVIQTKRLCIMAHAGTLAVCHRPLVVTSAQH